MWVNGWTAAVVGQDDDDFFAPGTQGTGCGQYSEQQLLAIFGITGQTPPPTLGEPTEAPSQKCYCTKCGFYEGDWYWVIVTTVGGFLVGLIRFLIKYPRNMKGLFVEITEFHVEPMWAPITFCLSVLSLSTGASLGPEQALVIIDINSFWSRDQ